MSNNLFKKVTSAGTALLIGFSLVSPTAGAAFASTQLESANTLAKLGIIVDNSSNTVNYRLGDNITRGEVAKVVMNLSGEKVTDTCTGKYKDLTSSQWQCKYAEAGLAKNFFAANETFRPDDNITKAEALKMVMQARGISKGSDADWRKAYVDAAVTARVLDTAFTDYDTLATRGWIFQDAVRALDETSTVASDDIAKKFQDLVKASGENNQGGTSSGTTIVNANNTLLVKLAADTPESSTIPGGVNGFPVAKYTFTAGKEDVTITSLTVKRTGLSDKDTLEGIAAFTDEDGRVSKARNDNLEDNTEANLQLVGGLTIKAGETKNLTLVANVAASKDAQGDEFFLTIKEITASVAVETNGSLTSNKFTVGAVDAATLTFEENGNVPDPTLGATQADMFKFKVSGDSNQDVVINSITFRANNDAAEDLSNFKLYNGSTEVAATPSMTSKYLTFTFKDGFTITANRTERFTVKADVVSGAGDIIEWSIDKELDVSAVDTKYGYGAAVNIDKATALSKINILAGQLTIGAVNPDSDKVRPAQKAAVLAELKVTNNESSTLELQQFSMPIALTTTNSSGTVAKIFEKVELYDVDSGKAYQLDPDAKDSGKYYYDKDASIIIKPGTTRLQVRADVYNKLTLEKNGIITNTGTIYKFSDYKFKLTMASLTGSFDDGTFKVVEMDDEKVVTDIAPSSLSWKVVQGTDASATVTVINRDAEIKKVKGSQDVEAMVFQIEADKSSDLLIDTLKVKVLETLSGSISTGAADNQAIAQVKLYEGKEVSGEPLAWVSGNKLKDGVAEFNTDITVTAGGTNVYVVAIDFVDNENLKGNKYNVVVAAGGLTVSDAEGNTIEYTDGEKTNGRKIVITEAGVLTVTDDANNDDNKDKKVILLGSNGVVYSMDVSAKNEEIKVKNVEVTFSGVTKLKSSVDYAELIVDGKSMAKNNHGDLTDTSMVFKNIDTLIIPTKSTELQVKLYTNTSAGDEQITDIITNGKVKEIKFTDAEGMTSSAEAKINSSTVITAGAKEFALVPAIVTPSVDKQMSANDSTSKITLTVDSGKNTTSDNSSYEVAIKELKFKVTGDTSILNAGSGYVELYKDGDTVKTASGTDFTNGILTVTLSGAVDNVISKSNTYIMSLKTVTGQEGNVSFTLIRDGIVYTVAGKEITSYSSKEQEVGSYKK